MKKYLSVFIFSALVTPSVAFASWWNPVSWFSNWTFQSTNIETQILENRVKELENKLESKNTPTSAISNTPATTSISSYQELLKDKQERADAIRTALSSSTNTNSNAMKTVNQQVDNSAIIEAQVKVQVESRMKAKAVQDELNAKIKAEEQMRRDALKAEADMLTAQNAARIAAQYEEEQQAFKNAFEAKQQKLNAINLQIANLNAKYASDSVEIKLNKEGGFGGAVQSKLNSLFSKYEDDYNLLMAEYQQIKYSN